MSESELKDKDSDKKIIEVDKSSFGLLRPLTAAQVVSLLINSDVALGACACGPCACGGPCY